MAGKAGLMETIAVYWEPKIKTYGMAQKTGLCLVSTITVLNDTVVVLEEMCAQATLSQALIMISAGYQAGKGLRTSLVFDLPGESIENRLELFNHVGHIFSDGNLEIVPDVDMVYFHGPHYGDRYGIASTVFTALMAAAVPLLASACSASSIYLVVPKGRADDARNALSKDVIVPQTEPKSPS
jgi:aspartokinase